MGANYYAIVAKQGAECRLHIGKSSAGWCFGLHVGSDAEPEVPRSLVEWRAVWAQALRIEDEYREPLTPEAMERIVTQRRQPQRERDEAWYRANHAEPGPHNLARHTLGRYCVGHGDGPYDLIVGQFS